MTAGQSSLPPPPPLRFGIYPGGPAGSVNPKAPPRPENPARRLAALKELAGSKPFVVRLYSAWTGDAAADDVAGWLDGDIAGYTASGLQVELVVRYKPTKLDRVSAPSAFADHVRRIVSRYGADPRFVSIQVTNEANIAGAPDAADGAFAGAVEALVKGVIAAKAEVRRAGYGHVRVGFSWAYDERPRASTEFWAALGRVGGSAFSEAVDWVGLDTYPGTWSPALSLSNRLPRRAGRAVKESVRALRDCYMPMAGLGGSTSLHVAENGFPTGPGRSELQQARVLAAMVHSVNAIRATYGVTDYRWFDLRDSATADRSVESQYGITRDDYSPKPAFGIYRALIAGHGEPGTGPGDRARPCRPSRVNVPVPRPKHRRVASLVVRVGHKVVGTLRRARIKRVVSISMRSGRSVVRLRLQTKAHGHRLVRVKRRTYRVC